MTLQEYRELAAFHHRQGVDLARAVETTDGRPAVKQGLAAKAGWHLRISASLTEEANTLESTTQSAIRHVHHS